jgi:hypothetical protein
MLRVNHVPIHMNRFREQLLLPFFPPQLVGLSNEGSWDPIR